MIFGISPLDSISSTSGDFIDLISEQSTFIDFQEAIETTQRRGVVEDPLDVSEEEKEPQEGEYPKEVEEMLDDKFLKALESLKLRPNMEALVYIGNLELE